VPGTVDAWFALHERFGKLPIATDLAQAIGYATHGFPVTQLIALYWKGNMARIRKRQSPDRRTR
jgi:gamma-glutamyltranspeptidase/glutathione hydrolase